MYNEIPLNRVPEVPGNDWQGRYDDLMLDPYIRKKCNRERRLKEKFKYIDRFLPEVIKKPGLVLDIGPGPGEFLEICRYYGNDVIGVDAKMDDCDMGVNYIQYSNLMAIRQNLDIAYTGNPIEFMKSCAPFDFINAQGSIIMMFIDCVEGGEKLKEHKDTRLVKWKETPDTKLTFRLFLESCMRSLYGGGQVLLYANGCGNTPWYNDAMLSAGKEVFSKSEQPISLVHRFTK